MPRGTTLNINGTGAAVQLPDVRCDSVIFESPGSNAQPIGILEAGTAVIVADLRNGTLAMSYVVTIKGISARAGGVPGNLNQFDANIAIGDFLIVRPFCT